jgi:hypothetical protein
MRNRKDEDLLILDSIDQTIRKLVDPGLPEKGSCHGTGLRVTPSEKDSSFNTFKKRIAKPRSPAFVEILGFEELPLGQRVPSRPDHRRRARASRKTSSESCASTLPRRISS